MKAIREILNPPARDNGQDEVRRMYREVFGTRVGKQVLANMLAELGYFNEIIATPEEIAHLNYARRLLSIMGIMQAKNVEGMVEMLMSLPFEEDK